ncbi:MAG: two-component regulator propeller domain-containing protein, partial [Chitinophagaceae bacterium]
MKTSLLHILLLCCIPALGQDYTYIHYNSKDGLASSTVYRMCQDKKGYMWFATDNGVSMFDGKKFTNYTIKDGLTDNEILSIYADSKGRVWLLPFGSKPCYYYEGKIHSPDNDSSLRKLRLPSFAPIGGENEKGELFFWTSDGIVLFKNSGETKLVADYRKLSKQYSLPLSNFIATYRPRS